MTQEDLGRALELSQEAIAAYERGGRFPRPTALLGMARLFGVSLDALLEEGGQETEGNWSPEGLLETLRGGNFEEAQAYSGSWRKARFTDLASFFQAAYMPLLASIGRLWQSGSLSVADEHFLSERIRELSLLEAESAGRAGPPPPADGPRWMGFCGPGERHELALFLLSLALRQEGWTTRFLGVQVPLADLVAAVEIHKPLVLASSVTLEENAEGLELYLRRIRERFGPSPAILVGGQGGARRREAWAGLVDAYADSIVEGLEFARRLGSGSQSPDTGIDLPGQDPGRSEYPS